MEAVLGVGTTKNPQLMAERSMLRRLRERIREEGSAAAPLLRETLTTLQRAIAFMELYWANGHEPVANCVKRTIARLIEGASVREIEDLPVTGGRVSLADLVMVCHPKPTSEAQRQALRAHIKGRCNGRA